MKLKKCTDHGYTLQRSCKVCGVETKDAHYKFVKIKSVAQSQKSVF